MKHADKIVIWGMSCAGKTTFARSIVDHQYICFDAMFNWHEIETLGLSISANLLAVKQECEKHDRYVLDGWHLGDCEGLFLPEGATAYVVYASYDTIASRYPEGVVGEAHLPMFMQWYYDAPPTARYFLNETDIVETSREEFLTSIDTSLQTGRLDYLGTRPSLRHN